jgi:ribosomal protein L19
MDLIQTLTDQYIKPELPAMNVGDTVRVTVRVVEGAGRHQRNHHRQTHFLQCGL